MKKNTSVLGFATVALALSNSPALARAIQIDQNWTAFGGTAVTNLQTPDAASTLNGLNFCTNAYTQVWTVSGAQSCAGTDPHANSSTGFVQLLSVPDAIGVGNFAMNNVNSLNGQFRVRWGDPKFPPSGVALNPDGSENLFGEISFYSAGNGVTGDFDFDFAYGIGFPGDAPYAYDYGIQPGQNSAGRSQVISLTSASVVTSSGLSGNTPSVRYCYRQAGGGQLGTVNAGGCSLDTASVPEPGTLALVFGAMGFLGLARRRRLPF